jgi:serine/threonine protein kinase
MLRSDDEPVPGYRLDVMLGRGGFGEVWRAIGPGRTTVALKFINLTGRPGLKEFRAIQHVKEIRHIHLLPIHAFWMLDERGRPVNDDALAGLERLAKQRVREPQFSPGSPMTLVVAMLVADSNLLDLLQKHKTAGQKGIPLPDLLRYMEDTARAIDFLNSPRHDLGRGPVAIQHCDIKPENLMLLSDSVLVCDFGLAQVLGDSQLSTGVCGTPAYMAPEVINGKGASCTTDQYSLAITYYHLRTATLPFSCVGPMDIIEAHRLGQLNFANVGAGEAEVLRRATNLDPESRLATTRDLITQLRSAGEEAKVFRSQAPNKGSNASTGPLDDQKDLREQKDVSGLSWDSEFEPGDSRSPSCAESDASGEPPNKDEGFWLEVVPGSEGDYYVERVTHGGGRSMGRSRLMLRSRTCESLIRQWEQLLASPEPLSSTAMSQLSRSLFRLTLPDELQETFHARKGPVVIAGPECGLPWEWLHDGRGLVAETRELSRWPLPAPDRSAHEAAGSDERQWERILVIADPLGGCPESANEARELASNWKASGLECHLCVGPADCQFLDLMGLLDQYEFDLIHVTAQSGVVDTGDELAVRLPENEWLLTEDVARMLRGQPLIFWNVTSEIPWSAGEAHAGRAAKETWLTAHRLLEGNRHGAASALIALNWWPRSSPPWGLAARFYNALDNGLPVGQALSVARRDCHEHAQDPREALSYVLFGNARLSVARRVTSDSKDQKASESEQSSAELPHPETVPVMGANTEAKSDSPHSNIDARDPPTDVAGFEESLDIKKLIEGILEGPRSSPRMGSDMVLAIVGAVKAMKDTQWTVLTTIHLWIGLTYVPGGKLSRTLRDQGLDPSRLRSILRDAIRQDNPSDSPSAVALSDNTKNALTQAAKLARQAKQSAVREHHLLEALAMLPDSSANALLRAVKLDPAQFVQRDADAN